jgi:hypothetical protein
MNERLNFIIFLEKTKLEGGVETNYNVKKLLNGGIQNDYMDISC